MPRQLRLSPVNRIAGRSARWTAMIDVRFFPRAAAISQGAFRPFISGRSPLPDGRVVTDLLQPEWANLRFFAATAPDAGIPDGEMVSGARFVGHRPELASRAISRSAPRGCGASACSRWAGRSSAMAAAANAPTWWSMGKSIRPLPISPQLAGTSSGDADEQADEQFERWSTASVRAIATVPDEERIARDPRRAGRPRVASVGRSSPSCAD